MGAARAGVTSCKHDVSWKLVLDIQVVLLHLSLLEVQIL